MILARLIKRLRQERGFTLIEMMIVVTILGFLATVSATLVTILFTLNLRSSQLGSQQTTIENTFGFLSSRIALIQYGELGVQEVGLSPSIDPLTLAGDQILFTSSFSSDSSVSSSEVCFRISYLAELGELRVASGDGSCASSANSDIMPKRGPNAYLWEQNGSPYRLPGQAGFDPVIDSAYTAVTDKCNESGLSAPESADCAKINTVDPWVLATGIENYNPSQDWNRVPGDLRAALPTDLRSNDHKFLPPFAFADRGGGTLAWNQGSSPSTFEPIPVAGRGSASPYPSAPTISSAIGGVDLRALVSPISGESGKETTIALRFYQQEYSLQQLCAIYERPNAQAGGDLTGTYPSPTIAPGAITYDYFASGGDAFPYDQDETFTQATLPGGASYTNLLSYSPEDVSPNADPAEREQLMPRGRYLVIGSVLGSSVLDSSSGTSQTAVELSLAHQVGTQTSLVATNAGTLWPLSVSGIINDLKPWEDTVFLRARSKQGGVVVPTNESPGNPADKRPISIKLYWLGKP